MNSDKNKTTTVWMVVNHPMNFSSILRIGGELREKLSIKTGLIYFTHPFWTKVAVDTYASQFNSVVALDIILEPTTWKDLLPISKLISDANGKLDAAGVKKTDFFIFFNYNYTLFNVVLSRYSGAHFCLVLKENAAKEYINYKQGTHYFIIQRYRKMNLLELWRGMKKTIRASVPTSHTTAEWCLFFEKPLDKLFERAFIERYTDIQDPTLENIGDFFRKTASTVKNLAQAPTLPSNETKVVYFSGGFGACYPDYRKPILESLNQGLNYIRREFPGYKWCYRPHPGLEMEEHDLDLSGFTIERDGQLAELYLLQNINNIHCTVSDLSTCVALAANMGFPTISFGRLVGLNPKEIDQFFENYSVPESVQMLKSFDEKPSVSWQQSTHDSNAGHPPLTQEVLAWTREALADK